MTGTTSKGCHYPWQSRIGQCGMYSVDNKELTRCSPTLKENRVAILAWWEQWAHCPVEVEPEVLVRQENMLAIKVKGEFSWWAGEFPSPIPSHYMVLLVTIRSPTWACPDQHTFRVSMGEPISWWLPGKSPTEAWPQLCHSVAYQANWISPPYPVNQISQSYRPIRCE